MAAAPTATLTPIELQDFICSICKLENNKQQNLLKRNFRFFQQYFSY
jgi:hypothetical protein